MKDTIKCIQCNIKKKEIEYYKIGKNKEEIRKRCKKCMNINGKKWRNKNKEYLKKYYIDNNENIKESGKKYYIKNKNIIKIMVKAYQKNNKEKINKNRKKYYCNNEVKKMCACRNKLNEKVRNNKIRRRNSCEICHNSPTEFHHDDYNKPFEFIELCIKCHNFLHTQIRSAIIVKK